ncbi:Vascular endothelial growth factor receptor 1, partial [Geodia barretti]
APVLVDICSSAAVSLCQNGGTCLNRGNSFSCQCTDGWTGPQCDQNDPVLSAPVLVKSPQTTFAQLFSETVLECGAVGNPQPLITWFKDGLEMMGATTKTLVIGEVDLSDRAAYHCTAVNPQGSVTSEVAYLNIMGLAQYAVVVISVETDLSEVDKWFDVNIEGTDTDIGGSGRKVNVLCMDSFNQTGEETWSSFISLQSVDGEDPKLPQVAEGISNLLTTAGDELRIELFLYDITRTDGCPEVTTILFNSTDFELPWPELPYGGLAEISCPCNAATLPLSASRRCAGNIAGGVAEWAEPDDSQCHFTEATRILCSVPDIEELSSVTDHPEDLGTLEVFLSAVNIRLFSDNTTTGNATRSDEVLAAIDHLLSAPPEVLQQSQLEFNSSTLYV